MYAACFSGMLALDVECFGFVWLLRLVVGVSGFGRGCLLLIGETALYCFLSFLAPSDEFTC